MLFTMISLCLFTSMPSFMLWRTVTLQWGQESGQGRRVRGLHDPAYRQPGLGEPELLAYRNLQSSHFQACLEKTTWSLFVSLSALASSSLGKAHPRTQRPVTGTEAALQALDSELKRKQQRTLE